MPLPWCTSQSTTAIRATPRVARRWRAAIAMLPKHAEAAAARPAPRGGRAAVRARTRVDAPVEHGVGRDHAAARGEPRDLERPARTACHRRRRRRLRRSPRSSHVEVAGLVQAEDLLVRRGARRELHQRGRDRSRRAGSAGAACVSGDSQCGYGSITGGPGLHHARVVPEVALVEDEADRLTRTASGRAGRPMHRAPRSRRR